MNLKDAFVCIDCDEVFAIDVSRCNPRCPKCASSVSAPLSIWVRTWGALDRLREETPAPRIEIIHATCAAA
jgi:hypothetical protein